MKHSENTIGRSEASLLFAIAFRCKSMARVLLLRWFCFVFAFCVVGTFASAIDGVEPEQVIEPIHPSKLLQSMPRTPQGWKCLQSRGKTEVSVRSVPVTSVARKYEIPIEDQEKPMVLTITVRDVGSQKETAEYFRARLRQSEKAESAEENSFISGVKGRLTDSSEDRIQWDGIIGERLVVRLEGSDTATDKMREALKGLDFTALVEVEKNLPGRIVQGNTYAIHRVDELNPSANRSSSLTLSYSTEGLSQAPASLVPPRDSWGPAPQ